MKNIKQKVFMIPFSKDDILVMLSVIAEFNSAVARGEARHNITHEKETIKGLVNRLFPYQRALVEDDLDLLIDAQLMHTAGTDEWAKEFFKGQARKNFAKYENEKLQKGLESIERGIYPED